MLTKLSQWLNRYLDTGGGSAPAPFSPAQKQLAMAALLVEVAQADHHFSAAEVTHLLQLLERKFALAAAEQSALLELARSHSADATSLHQFTNLVHRQCSPDEKKALLLAMWELAYADGEVDKYEDYLIRKVVDLLHLSHTDFIRAKHLAKERMPREH
jgi:uncharacterized tellurite resistance protein B-like protein